MADKMWRLIFGGMLILGGCLFMLQQAGIVTSGWDIFWAILMGLGGVAFVSIFMRDRRHWWALIPGLMLIGMGITALLPDSLEKLGGAVFMGMFALAFWLIYAMDRDQWWAIIPGGVLATLGVVSALSFDQWITGGVFFGGLALTFFLVAVLPKPQGVMTWAFIPSAVLFFMAMGMITFKMQDIMMYVWPAILLIGGGYLIFVYFRER